MKVLEEVYIYNKEKVIGILKIYSGSINLPCRFYDMDRFNKIVLSK